GRVIVADGAGPLAVGELRVDRVGQVDEERLVGLRRGVAVHRHRDRLARVAGVEGEVAARGLVVVVDRGRRAVSRSEVDGHRQGAGEGDTDGEDRAGRATVALYPGHIVDADGGVVVEDRPLGTADK